MDIKILYEDADLIVCVKPAGIASQTRQIAQQDMVSLLCNYRSRKKEEAYIGLIHRLDQPVEGILVFAKHAKAAAALSRQLAKGAFTKKYLAVAQGTMPKQEGILEHFVKKDSRRQMAYVTDAHDPQAKRAQLKYRVLETRICTDYGMGLCEDLGKDESERFREDTKTHQNAELSIDTRTHKGRKLCTDPGKEESIGLCIDTSADEGKGLYTDISKEESIGLRTETSTYEKKASRGFLGNPEDEKSVYSLVEIKLITGRFHQIRVQMAHMGAPLAGDFKYHPACKGMQEQGGLALCAYELAFVHPIKKNKLTFHIKPTAALFQQFQTMQNFDILSKK